MKKKFALLCTAAVVGGAVFAGTAAPALATCNDGTSQKRDLEGQNTDPNAPDYNPNYGQPTREDDLHTTDATGSETVIYGDGAEENLNPGYLGVTGARGFIEVSGANDDAPNVQIDGQTAGGEVDGRVGVDTGNTDAPADACINDNELL
jgi:hypothetical protein